MRPSGFTRFLALICALLFSLTAAGALLWVSADRELLNPVTYKNALTTQGDYPHLPAHVSEQIVLALNGRPCADNPLRCPNANPQLKDCFQSTLGPWRSGAIGAGVEKPTETESAIIQACIDKIQPDLQTAGIGSGGVLAFFQHVKAKDLERVITPLLPPDEMKPLADSFLDQWFAYLNGRQQNITLDLTGIKAALKGPGGLDTVLLILRSQPPCTFEQLQQLLQITLTGQGNLTLCSPAPELLGLLTPFIQSTLSAAVDTIPDSEVLAPLKLGTSRSFGPFGTGAAGASRFTLTLLRLSPLLPLLFLLLVTLLVVRSMRDFLRWWGIPLFLAGILVLAAGLLGPALFEPAWVGLLTGLVPDTLSVGLVGTIHDLVLAVMRPFWQEMDILGAVVALPGLVMWIASAFIHII